MTSLPGLQQRDDVVGVGVHAVTLARGVEHDVGIEGEDRVTVVGREHADRLATGDHAGVDADLVRAVDEQPDELELGIVDDLLQLRRPDGAGGPLDDAGRHDRRSAGPRDPSMVPWNTVRLPSGEHPSRHEVLGTHPALPDEPTEPHAGPRRARRGGHHLDVLQRVLDPRPGERRARRRWRARSCAPCRSSRRA